MLQPSLTLQQHKVYFHTVQRQGEPGQRHSHLKAAVQFLPPPSLLGLHSHCLKDTRPSGHRRTHLTVGYVCNKGKVGTGDK